MITKQASSLLDPSTKTSTSTKKQKRIVISLTLSWAMITYQNRHKLKKIIVSIISLCLPKPSNNLSKE